MSKPINIKIQSTCFTSGTTINATHNDLMVELSVTVVLSHSNYIKYQDKPLGINDLNEIIKKRI